MHKEKRYAHVRGRSSERWPPLTSGRPARVRGLPVDSLLGHRIQTRVGLYGAIPPRPSEQLGKGKTDIVFVLEGVFVSASVELIYHDIEQFDLTTPLREEPWFTIEYTCAGISQLFALVTDIHFELPSLKAHQHAAEFLPGDLSTIDDEKRHAAILGIVPFNPASHDSMVRDLQSELTVHEMFSGQGTTHLLDQLAKQDEQILIRITDDLEPVASRRPVANLEGVEGDSGRAQMGAKVKFVDLSRAIGKTYRFELGVFESLQPSDSGHFHVKALATKPSVSMFHRAIVDDVIAWCNLATTVATDLLVSRELRRIHFGEYTRQQGLRVHRLGRGIRPQSR